MEREFVAWFAVCPAWIEPLPQVGDVQLATNQAAIEIETHSPPEGSRIMVFQLADSELRFVLAGGDFLEYCPPPAHRIYLLAFTNLLKTAGVAASDLAEVGSAVVPWADWVAAWENSDGPTRQCDAKSNSASLRGT